VELLASSKLFRVRALLFIVLLVAALACDTAGNQVEQVVACDGTALAARGTSFEPSDVALNLERGGDPSLDPVAADLASYLGKMWGGAFTAVDAPPDFSKKLTIWISTSQDARTAAGFTATDGYSIVRLDPPGQTRVLVVANDAKNLAFGAYALLEELGARFFHPLDEIVPALSHPVVPYSMHITRAAAFRTRGLQLHTLHPIEYFHVFNEPSDEHFAEAKRFVDWLVKTGQNYFQWVELATVDWASWQPYAQSIVDYAHSRGVRVGANIQVWGGASLQNNYVLVTDATNWQPQMDAGLDKIMTIGWDTLELALGEFVSADPQEVIDWLNEAVQHVLSAHPNVEVDVQNHVGNYSNLYVQYQGQTVYYYHLPQFADARLGQTVHTLSLFDLYRDWATYAHPDFHFQHDYILQELPTRRVSYFPESAYWISADIDVPLFLPEFLQARWNDIHGLVSDVTKAGLPPLEGHLMFSSGQEWNYWLTDYLTAKMLWEPMQPLSYFIDHYANAFGSCGADIGSAVSSLVDLQNHYLFDERLLPYVQGENATVDEGYLLGYETHPKRVAFETVLAMAPPDRADFVANVVSEVEAYAAAIQPLEDAVAARCRGADASIASFCGELWDGIEIDRLRASQSAALYRSILDLAAGGDGKADLARAQSFTSLAAQVIARREPHYRFPLHDLVDSYPNATAYAFGYLRTAHTLCYWTRQEMQVQALMQDGVPATVSTLPGCTN
jgi:hypothetical protein